MNREKEKSIDGTKDFPVKETKKDHKYREMITIPPIQYPWKQSQSVVERRVAVLTITEEKEEEEEEEFWWRKEKQPGAVKKKVFNMLGRRAKTL